MQAFARERRRGPGATRTVHIEKVTSKEHREQARKEVGPLVREAPRRTRSALGPEASREAKWTCVVVGCGGSQAGGTHHILCQKKQPGSEAGWLSRAFLLLLVERLRSKSSRSRRASTCRSWRRQRRRPRKDAQAAAAAAAAASQSASTFRFNATATSSSSARSAHDPASGSSQILTGTAGRGADLPANEVQAARSGGTGEVAAELSGSAANPVLVTATAASSVTL